MPDDVHNHIHFLEIRGGDGLPVFRAKLSFWPEDKAEDNFSLMSFADMMKLIEQIQFNITLNLGVTK